MTTGNIISLTMWTCVRKVMSLLFNTLSSFVIAFLPRSKCVLISLAAVTICSDFGAQENKICHCFHFPHLPWNPARTLVWSAVLPLNHCHKTPHQVSLVGTHSFWGRRLLCPGKAIKLFFSLSPRTVSEIQFTGAQRLSFGHHLLLASSTSLSRNTHSLDLLYSISFIKAMA